MIRVLNFIKNQWFGVFIIIILLFVNYQSSRQIELYEQKLKDINEQIEIYKERRDYLEKED